MKTTTIDLLMIADIGLIICFLGMCGIFINTRNILISLISIEMMFYGLNIYLIALSLYLDDMAGLILSLFLLTIAAAESAIGLALLVSTKSANNCPRKSSKYTEKNKKFKLTAKSMSSIDMSIIRIFLRFKKIPQIPSKNKIMDTAKN